MLGVKADAQSKLRADECSKCHHGDGGKRWKASDGFHAQSYAWNRWIDASRRSVKHPPRVGTNRYKAQPRNDCQACCQAPSVEREGRAMTHSHTVNFLAGLAILVIGFACLVLP